LDKQLPEPKNEIIGIDLGIKDFVITSNGDKYKNLKTIRSNEKKLVKLNRQLSKKEKGSKNKNKARLKLARFHETLNNKKLNYLHHITNELLSENQTIVMENLNVEGMLKNHNLARSLQELSLGEFKRILKYKAEWYGREVIEVYRGFDKEERIVSKGWVIYTPSELPVVSGCGDDALITAYKTIRLIQENIVKEHQLSPLDDTDIIEMIKNAMEIVSQVSAGCSGDITYEII